MRQAPAVGFVLLVLASPAAAQPIVPASSADWIVEGAQPTGTFGSHVAPAGDVDGDGYDDVLIGDPSFDGAFEDSGRITIHRGSASGLSIPPDWSLEGDGPRAFLSRAFGAGDVNGDGYADIVVQFAESRLDASVALFLGSASGLSPIPAWTAMGSYRGRGDVDGDGLDDIGIQVPPKLNIYLGSATGLAPAPSMSVPAPLASGPGAFAFEDLNGDGRVDLGVALTVRDGNGVDRVAVLSTYHGSASGLKMRELVRFPGPNVRPVVTAAGDVDGDGFGDLAVTLNVDPTVNVNQSGDLLVFRGSISGIRTPPDRVLQFGEGRLGLGPIAGAGDLHGDGFADLLVPDYLFAVFGRVLKVLNGGAGGIRPVPALTISEPASPAAFGRAASAAGDVNGDGYGDFIVSAPDVATGGLPFGRVYVFHGGPSL